MARQQFDEGQGPGPFGIAGAKAAAVQDLLKIEVRICERAAVIDLDGEIDIAVIPRLERVMNEVMDNGCLKMTINLERAVYMDSWGLRLLESVHHRMRACAGTLSLARPSAIVRRLLAVTRLDSVLNTLPDEPAAPAAPLNTEGIWHGAALRFDAMALSSN